MADSGSSWICIDPELVVGSRSMGTNSYFWPNVALSCLYVEYRRRNNWRVGIRAHGLLGYWCLWLHHRCQIRVKYATLILVSSFVSCDFRWRHGLLSISFGPRRTLPHNFHTYRLRICKICCDRNQVTWR